MAQSVVSVGEFPGYRPGVEERWMEMDGARMRYLRTAGSVASSPHLANPARCGASHVSFPYKTNPPLILLHGLMGYSFSWRNTLPAVAPYAEAYALDLMGAGFSDRPHGIDHSMRGCAERVVRFAEELGISEFDLLGTSHGGAVAMMAAAQCLRPTSRVRVRRLILVAPVNPYSAHGRRLAPLVGSPLGTILFRHTVAHMHRVFAYAHARMYGDRRRIPADALEGYMAPMAKPGLFDHALSIVSTWTRDLRELEEALPKLGAIPALLMWGSVDSAVYASSAERLKKFFPESEIVIFPGIGHLPYEECPEEFNRELIAFLARENVGV